MEKLVRVISTSCLLTLLSGSNAGGGVPGDFVCHLRDVGVKIPGGKKLFECVSLGFLRGTKIGRWVKDGLRIGYLE
ncbi:hypothetical protein PybrP1_000581 [[Pythium] brassicae (nom. inval.)]|nr:hypothetical protein PybrP1_000581 [[Pythium] brassicae (nom. inval.)]